MTITLHWLTAITAILAPTLHLLSDTLIALEEAISKYEMLLGKLGGVCSFHGELMVAGVHCLELLPYVLKFCGEALSVSS